MGPRDLQTRDMDKTPQIPYLKEEQREISGPKGNALKEFEIVEQRLGPGSEDDFESRRLS